MYFQQNILKSFHNKVKQMKSQVNITFPVTLQVPFIEKDEFALSIISCSLSCARA